MKQVQPEVFLIGETIINVPGLEAYLKISGNDEFLETIAEARAEGLGDMEIISSFFAKLCYRSLTLGQNLNVTKLRSIADNIISTIESGHGSVFEHVWFNFALHNVSRVLTHELVRHRIGVAYSQESGRYCRIPPEGPGMFLPSCIIDNPTAVQIFEETVDFCTQQVQKLYTLFNINEDNFTEKKTLTSAIRRIAPTGTANEIGFSVNVREARHIIGMRTSRHAEEEIRLVFARVAEIIHERCSLLLHGGQPEIINGIAEWTFPRSHGYER